jgi:hypothetical protein
MISRLPPPGIQLILTIPRQAGLYRARPAAHGRQPVLADVGMVGLIAGTNQRHAALDTERDPAPEAASTLSTAASIVRLTSSAAATGRPEPVSYRLQIPAQLDHLWFTPGANQNVRLLYRLPSDNVVGKRGRGHQRGGCRGGRGG